LTNGQEFARHSIAGKNKSAGFKLTARHASFIVIPCTLVYFFAQHIFIQGIVFTSIKG
jgi:ABC-type glycerol-3-phosphate transport system permease component